MSLKYSLAEIYTPLSPDKAKRIYARSQVREKINMYRIAREIAYATSLTEGDVISVLYSLIHKVNTHLGNGDYVSLGDFGKFYYQISSEGAETKEDFNFSKIRKVRIRFRPGKLLCPSPDELEFECVMSVKTRRKTLKVTGK